jgi:hypothetical protein
MGFCWRRDVGLHALNFLVGPESAADWPLHAKLTHVQRIADGITAKSEWFQGPSVSAGRAIQSPRLKLEGPFDDVRISP